ncbi:MAG: lipopolysaccharide heptosyltransferase II [Deltaproteobacteria bacterium]
MVKLWAIGDAVLTLPLLRALRNRYPEAEIAVLCHRSNRPVFEASGIALRVIEADLPNMARQVRRYDICFDTEPYLNGSALLSWLLSGCRVGFRNGSRWRFYDHAVEVCDTRHALEQILAMGRFIRAEGPPDPVPLSVPEEVDASVDRILRKHGIGPETRRVGICAGGGPSVLARRWPKESFREFVRRLLEEEPGTRAILVGTAEDRATHAFIRNGSPGVVDLAGECSLAETFGLIRRMHAFVSNDTGMMHVAAAQRVPTLGIFGPSSPRLWRPYGPGNRFLWNGPEVCEHCPCNLPHRGLIPECILRGERRDVCIRSVSVEEALRAYRGMTT